MALYNQCKFKIRKIDKYFHLKNDDGYIMKYQRRNKNNIITYNNVYRHIRNFMIKLYNKRQISNVYNYHDLRKYFLTRMYIKTKDIIYVKNLAGHADAQTTQIYIKLDELNIKNNNYQF